MDTELRAEDGHTLAAYAAGPRDAQRGLVVAQEIFGMSPQRYRRLRDSGWSPQRIAAAGDRSLREATQALRTILAKRGAQAVRAGAMSRRQAATLLGHQEAGLAAYMTRRYRTTAQQEAFCRLR